jgi:hypothetical protein
MQKIYFTSLSFYTNLIVVCLLLKYFGLLPARLTNAITVAIFIACIFFAAAVFAKNYKRIAMLKERFVFALILAFYSQIMNTLLFAYPNYIFHLFELLTQRFFIISLNSIIIKFLGAFYFFNFFIKLSLKDANRR